MPDELEQLKRENPELRYRIERDRKRYGERYLRAYNREVMKKIEKKAEKRKKEMENLLDEKVIKSEAKPIIKRSFSVFIENNPLKK